MWVNWLGQQFKSMALRSCLCQKIVRKRLAGKEDYPALREKFSNGLCRLNSIHLWHYYVAHDYIGLCFSGPLYRILAAKNGRCFETLAIQDVSQALGNECIIINNDYSLPCSHGSWIPFFRCR